MNDFLSKLLAGLPQSPPQDIGENDPYLDPKVLPSPLMSPMQSLQQENKDRQAIGMQFEPEDVQAYTPQPAKMSPSLPMTQPGNDLQIPDEVSQKQPSLSDILNQLPKSSQDTELANAQSENRDNIKDILLMKAANKINTSLAQVAPDEKYAQDFIDLSNKKVTDLQDKRKSERDLEDQDNKRRNQKISELKGDVDLQRANFELGDRQKENDPDSDVSKAFREYARSYVAQAGANIKIDDRLSYADLQKQMGTIGNAISAKMAADARKELMQMKLAETGTAKEDKATDKMKADFAKDIDTQRSSQRTNLGQLQKRLNTSENLKALISQNPKDMTDPEIRELVTGVNNLIGGSLAVSQIEHMDYPTLNREYSKLVTKATGNPAGANSPGVVNRLSRLIEREEEVVRHQMKKALDFSLAKHAKLVKKDPDYVNSLLEQTIYGGKAPTGNAPPPPVSKTMDAGSDPRVEAFMKANGISDKDQAIKILKENGKL